MLQDKTILLECVRQQEDMVANILSYTLLIFISFLPLHNMPWN